MQLLDGVFSLGGITFLIFSVLVVAVSGYLLGRINIKGLSLGIAGIFVAALIYGGVLGKYLYSCLESPDSTLKVIENIGLIFFITSIGFISGPSFFKDFKKHFKSYNLLAIIMIFSSGIVCVGCYFFGKGSFNDTKEYAALLTGVLSGALSSTSALSSAKATVLPQYETAVTVGNGIAYAFGVIGVVLFVQIVPKIMRVDMSKERLKIQQLCITKEEEDIHLKKIDKSGFAAFFFAALCGVILGAIKIPITTRGFSGATFSLTTTGGVIITSLLFGHIGKIGKISLRLSTSTLKILRELGLMLFLIGAGIMGGANLTKYFKFEYFIFGIIMTVVPMLVGFFFAKYVLKLDLLNILGAITGGMTSTPALGTLINVTSCEEVSISYASTYPMALMSVILVTQAIILIF